jgi:anti-repressor protein
MNDLIKIQTVDDQRLVDARELHEFLESKRDFSNWIKDRIEKYGFIENQDYISFAKIVERETGATTRIEYGLTIDMAKELSMVENNGRGRKARQYFIQKEKEALTSRSLYSPTKKQLAQWVIEQEEQIEQLRLASHNKDKTINQLKPKADYLDQIMDDKTLVDVGQAAKILGLPFGRNILFAKLRDQGILFKNRNEPKQEYIERGYFILKEKRIEPKNGIEPWLVIKVLVTQKGLRFLSELFRTNGPQGELALLQ